MNTDRVGGTAVPRFRGLLLLALTLALPTNAPAGVKVAEQEDFTLELGLRIQARMAYDGVAGSGGTTDWQRDFMVRRARLKANGKMLKASYGFEWKIDGTDQGSTNPSAAVENAWIQYPLGRGVEVRAGLYDQPYSRDRLTSDSRQLAVDRGNVSNVPNDLGLADNAVGFHFLGKAFNGRAGYAVGLFDNRFIPSPSQDSPMVVGRVDVNLGSTKDVYQDAHFGTESWYSIGVNGNNQVTATSTNSAAGVDGMVDVPTSAGRVFVKGEYSYIRIDRAGPVAPVDTRTWMAAAGLLVLHERLQPFFRFDEVRLDDQVGGTKTDIAYAGLNLYRKGHSLKFQGDVRFQANTNEPLDGARLQAQMDF